MQPRYASTQINSLALSAAVLHVLTQTHSEITMRDNNIENNAQKHIPHEYSTKSINEN